MKFSARLGSLLACGVLLLVSGCGGEGGPKTYSVKGKITNAGQPVSVPAGGRGTIEFTEGERTYQGSITADGSYQAEVGKGKYAVTVSILDKAAGGDDLFEGRFNSVNSKLEKEITGATTWDVDLPAK